MTGTLTAQWDGLDFVIQMRDKEGHVRQHIRLSGDEWEKVKHAAEEEVFSESHTQGDGQAVRCSKCVMEASYTNSVPDAANSRDGQAAYKLVPLCVSCAMEAKEISTSRINRLRN